MTAAFAACRSGWKPGHLSWCPPLVSFTPPISSELGQALLQSPPCVPTPMSLMVPAGRTSQRWAFSSPPCIVAGSVSSMVTPESPQHPHLRNLLPSSFSELLPSVPPHPSPVLELCFAHVTPSRVLVPIFSCSPSHPLALQHSAISDLDQTQPNENQARFYLLWENPI